MRNKNFMNYKALIVFVLFASFVVNVSATVLAQHGSASVGNVWQTLSAALTTSTDATLVPATTGSEEDTEDGVQVAAAGNIEDNVAQSALETEERVRPSIPASYHVMVTAYSSSVDETDATPFITASGSYVRDGIVAANFLPIGARVKMPDLYGEKVFVVEDRMNRRYSDRVDIWMPSKIEASQFGRRYTRIEVL